MKKCLFLFSLLSWVILSQAQTPLFKELKIIYNGKGLQVSCLILDNEGIIWLGGPQGVFTYNGNALKQVYNANRMSKAIVALYQVKVGQIWAGSKGGNILKFYNYQNVLFAPKNGFPKNEITSITESNEGNICFGTKGEGVFVYASDKLLNLRTANDLAGNTINCMVKNTKGELLVGTNSGIAYIIIKNNSIKVSKRLDTTSGLISNQVRALSNYNADNLVIGYYGRGASIYSESKGTFSIVCNEHETINSIETFENELWLGNEHQGIIDCEFAPKVIVRNLQILVENAIKHNKVSRSQPLFININVEKDFLIVKNKISPKEHLETSTKSGIKFIIDRFDFLNR